MPNFASMRKLLLSGITFVWIFSSANSQAWKTRGKWFSDGIWGEEELWYR